MEDAIRFYRFNETSDFYECTNPGCADPLDNDGPDPFVAQIAMGNDQDAYHVADLDAVGCNSMQMNTVDVRNSNLPVRQGHG